MFYINSTSVTLGVIGDESSGISRCLPVGSEEGESIIVIVEYIYSAVFYFSLPRYVVGLPFLFSLGLNLSVLVFRCTGLLFFSPTSPSSTRPPFDTTTCRTSSF